MKTLSKRLSAIAAFVEQDAIIGDIGSDHCALPIALFKEGRIRGAFAVENKKGPYTRMKKAIDESSYPIQSSLSSGLDELPKEVDTLILAGLGGPLIVEILSKNKDKLQNIKTILIDAHNDRALVNDFLEKNGFHIADNVFLVEGNISYDIMKWNKGKPLRPYTELEKEFGPLNLKRRPKEWLCSLRKSLQEKERIFSLLKEENQKKAVLEKEIETLKGILYENEKSYS